MIEYKLFSDNSGICSTRTATPIEDTVTLKFSGRDDIVRIGITKPNESERFYNLNGQTTEISRQAFGEGENKLTVYGKTKRWKCESLVLADNVITPYGVDTPEQLLLFKSEFEKLCARLSICESRLLTLEEKTNQKIIF